MKSDKTRVIDGPTMKPTLPFPLVMCQKRRGKGGSINNKTATTMQTLFVLSAAIAGTTSALSATTQTRSPTTPLPSKQNRPLLREFGRGREHHFSFRKDGFNIQLPLCVIHIQKVILQCINCCILVCFCICENINL